MTMTWADMPATWDAITAETWSYLDGQGPVPDHKLSALDIIMGYYNGAGIDPPISPFLTVEIAEFDTPISKNFQRSTAISSTLFAQSIALASRIFERTCEV